MTKDIIIDIANSTVRIPSAFTKQFRKNKQRRKLKAKLIFNEPKICSKESLIILVEANQ